ncbi:MAG: hypothetical protein GY854_17425 [Deltaproteobacteria bacterium]|nr:hypothetical protein [Deltaproteobacteria bacterium]
MINNMSSPELTNCTLEGNSAASTGGVTDCQADHTCENLCGSYTCRPNCYGLTYESPEICGGNGECVDVDTCECDDVNEDGLPEYLDAGCASPITCQGEAWYENEDGGVCSGNGTCVAPDECECDPGYYTPNGGTEECGGVLVCEWVSGDQDYVCGGRGDCIAVEESPTTGEGICVCEEGYLPDDCMRQIECYSVPWDLPNVCSGNGECVATDTCQCAPDVTGLECTRDARLCYGWRWDHPSVCNGLGECVYDQVEGRYICDCDDGWDGYDCREPVWCKGISAMYDNVCNSNGECVDHEICVCDFPWKGTYCEERYSCNGVDIEDPMVCSGRGECIADSGLCECDDGYSGADCSGVCR